MSWKFNPFTNYLDYFEKGARIGDPIYNGISGSVLFINSEGKLAQDNSNFYWDNVNKRLGIGTTAPTDKLEINGNVINGGGTTIITPGNAKYRIGTLGTSVPNWGGQFINAKYNQSAGNWNLDDTSLNAAFFKLDVRNASYGNEIAFYRMPAGSNPRPDSAWQRMLGLRLDTGDILMNVNVNGTPTTGNIGIGTTSPSQKLSVVGDIGLSGGNRFIGTTDNYALSLRTNNTDRVYITNAGNVGIGTTNPDATALLDLTSTTKGFLPPRMTTAQRNAISTPSVGLMIYNLTTNKLNFYNGTSWEEVTSG